MVLSLDHIAAASGSSVTNLIAGSTGVTILDPPPLSLEQNVIQSNNTTFLVPETDCFVLPSNVTVNIASDGTFLGGVNEGVVIPAGTAVCSFLLVADRSSNGTLSGSVTFTEDILGLIGLRPQFDASTPIFQLPNLTYPSASGVFLENNDDLTLTGSTLSWDMFMGGGFADAMRIIVECTLP